MKSYVLLINICKEKLHFYEFVTPVRDILKKEGIKYIVKDYRNIRKKDLEKSSKIIICGTSLKDNEFIKDINYFHFLKHKEFNKPVLGICGGMQIIGVLFNGRLKKKTEIGFYKENFKKDFLGLKRKQEVYHLHNNYVIFDLDNFEIYCDSGKVIQAVKHKKKPFYGVLFHPEVRNKKLITNFITTI